MTYKSLTENSKQSIIDNAARTRKRSIELGKVKMLSTSQPIEYVEGDRSIEQIAIDQDLMHNGKPSKAAAIRWLIDQYFDNKI